MSKIRVLIADDHAIVRMGLAALISAEADIEIVGEAKNGLVYNFESDYKFTNPFFREWLVRG